MLGIICSCGEIKQESEAICCEICGDICCRDCKTKCESCNNKVCKNCKSLFYPAVCQECENPYIQREINDLQNARDERHKNETERDSVFIIVAGMTYPISKNNTMGAELVDGTEPLPIGDKIQYIDIAGLGLLKYSYRTIRAKGKGAGFEYYLYFNPVMDVLPLPF